MKHTSRCNLAIAALGVAFLLGTQALAQPAAPQGSIRFANASAVPARVLLTVDAAKLRPDGFAAGELTGAIGILAGPHRLSATAEGAKPGEATVAIQPNILTTVVAYTKHIIDPQTRKPIAQLQVFSEVEPPREKGKHFRLLYVSERPSAALTVNGAAQTLTALHSAKADGAHGGVKIESAGKTVIDFGSAESGSFLIIIFDKLDGMLAAITLPDYG